MVGVPYCSNLSPSLPLLVDDSASVLNQDRINNRNPLFSRLNGLHTVETGAQALDLQKTLRFMPTLRSRCSGQQSWKVVQARLSRRKQEQVGFTEASNMNLATDDREHH